MTKKMKYSMLLLVWGIVVIQLFVNYSQRKEFEPVMAQFATEKENVYEQVTGYARLWDMELSETVKTNMMKHFCELLGCEMSPIKKEVNGGEEKWSILQEKEGDQLHIYLTTIRGRGKPQQYLMIESRKQIREIAMDSRYQSIGHLFQETGVNGKVMVEQSLEQRGNQLPKKAELEALFFEPLQAKVVKEIKENGICTIYGYTKKESMYFKQDEKRVNVQLVLSYDPDRDVTTIKLGIPLVNSTY